jgi:hypothetical protein
MRPDIELEISGRLVGISIDRSRGTVSFRYRGKRGGESWFVQQYLLDRAAPLDVVWDEEVGIFQIIPKKKRPSNSVAFERMATKTEGELVSVVRPSEEPREASGVYWVDR